MKLAVELMVVKLESGKIPIYSKLYSYLPYEVP